jgi:hypothetical protein
MEFPSVSEVGRESVDTLALIGGVTIAKIATTLLKKTGVVPSAVLLAGGFALSAYAPKNDKFRLKSMGKGVQAYAGMGLISELSKDTINLGINGVAGINGVSDIKNPLPASVRKYIADYVPTISGVPIELRGIEERYVNSRAMPLPAAEVNTDKLFAA